MSEVRTFRIPRLRSAPAAALSGLEADLAFCHPAVRGVVAIDAAHGTMDLEVEPSRAGDGQDLTRQLALVVDLSVRSYRFVEPQPPLWRHEAEARYAGGTAGLRTFVQEYLRQLGPGEWALIGPAAELRTYLDGKLREVAAAVEAEPWHLPSIERTDVLIPKTGYFSSHPQHVTFAYHLPPHFEQIRRFADAARVSRLSTIEDSSDLVPAGFILEPFVCHNVYLALRGMTLKRSRAITALGTCYRHEGFRFLPLLRQWEFSMREVVLVGTPAFVEQTRLRLIELTQELATRLDLDATLEIATDPFFVSEAASARTYQMMNSTKLEMRLGIEGATQTAAASFNLSGKHFTEPMQIRGEADEGALLDTACVAFGLERWMAAFIARWGSDPGRWQL